MEWNEVRVGRGSVLVPPDIRRLRHGLWLHAACRPTAVAVANGIGHLTKISTRIVPRRTQRWEIPLNTDAWEGFLAGARRTLGEERVRVLIAPAADPHRSRFHLLLLGPQDRPIAFARFTRNQPNRVALAAERLLTNRPPSTFWCPALIDDGTVEGWSFTLQEAMPAGPHAPARLTGAERRSMVEEIQHELHEVVGPGDTAAHGDFAPWNVRRLSDGRIAVIDWEGVGPAPKASDELWHCVTTVLSTGGTPSEAATAVLAELGHHSKDDLTRAIRFWRLRETRAEPKEVEDSGEAYRAPGLLAFESRLVETFDRLSTD